jgi:hypothetical protein
MSSKTLYDILGVKSNASPDEIEQAFKAKMAGPDLDDAMRIALREAHSVLSSMDRRNAYDARQREKAVADSELEVMLDRAARDHGPRNYTKVWLGIAIVFVGLMAFNTWRGTQIQKEIVEAQEHAFDKERELAEGTPEERAAAADREAQRKLEAEERRVDMERKRIEQENERAFANARREQDYTESRRADNQRREEERQKYEAQRREYEAQMREQRSESENRRLREQQLAREKAYLKQLEEDNKRFNLH